MRIKSMFVLAAACISLAACGGGGGGGNPPPTIPPVSPTATPTPVVTPTPVPFQMTYPGSGGSATVSFTYQKSAYSGVTEIVMCAYRGVLATNATPATDSHHCDPAHPYAPATGRGGVVGNYWVAPTNHVDNGASFTDTFQLTQAAGGDVGIIATVSSGTATFLNLTGAGVNVSSTPANMFQVLTSASEVIGPTCSAPNTCPTVTSLGATVGGFEQGTFQPDEVVITSAGHAYITTHSSLPSMGTGTDLTTQGFVSNGNNTMRFLPCASQTAGTACNPIWTNTLYSMSWFPTQAGSSWNIPLVNVTVGDLVGTPGAIPSQCGMLGVPTSAGATSGFLTDYTQVRVYTSSTTGSSVQASSGSTTPGVVCFSAT